MDQHRICARPYVVFFSLTYHALGACLWCQDTGVRVRRQWQPGAMASRRRRACQPAVLGRQDERRARDSKRVGELTELSSMAYSLLVVLCFTQLPTISFSESCTSTINCLGFCLNLVVIGLFFCFFFERSPGDKILT